MIAKIINGKDDNEVPYSELEFCPDDPRDGFYNFTFRKYPKRIFVAYEDDRDNPSSGCDLDDCWLAPTIIIQKVLHAEFDPYKSFLLAMKRLGEYDPQDEFSVAVCDEIYRQNESVIKKWLGGDTP